MLKPYLTKTFFFLVLLLSIISGRVFYLQKLHHAKAEEYYRASNFTLAIREYDLAMHMYIPWSPYMRLSAERLWQIAEMLEKKGDTALATIAYSSMRSSFYASRSLYTPGKDWIEKCDNKIASLNVTRLIDDGSIRPDQAIEEKNKHLSVMRKDRAPNPLWSVLLEFGFIGWVASIVFMIFRGFDENGKLKSMSALYGIGFFVFSLTVWLIASLNA